MHVLVEGLEGGQSFQPARFLLGAPRTHVDERAQCIARDRTQSLALAHRPNRIRLVAEEVARVQGHHPLEVRPRQRRPSHLERRRAHAGLSLELVRVHPHPLAIEAVAAAPADHGRRERPRGPTRFEPLT